MADLAPKVIRKGRKRKLTMADAQAIAELVVNYRMNESEAALSLGFKPMSWFNFKCRKSVEPEYNEMQSRIRAAQLKNCISAINKSGDDKDVEILTKSGETRTITRNGDWRAKAWIAERVLAPERFNERQQQQAPAPVVNVAIMSEALAKVFQAQALPEVKPAKQIEASPSDNSIDVETVK